MKDIVKAIGLVTVLVVATGTAGFIGGVMGQTCMESPEIRKTCEDAAKKLLARHEK